jgi:tetratricopeptide (TPR) repeat protein
LLKELGTAYLLSGQSEKSCDAFKTLTSMEADNPFFYCLLGEALLAAGKHREFEDAYRQAGLVDPDEADRYLFQAAGLCIKKGLFKEAKELLINCLELSPSNSLYYCSLGDVLVAINKIPDAFAQYEKACEYNPPHAAAYLNRLGISLMKAESFESAVKAFESSFTLDASTPCRQNLEEARRASVRSKKTPA